jgi:hypothetical protein
MPSTCSAVHRTLKKTRRYIGRALQRAHAGLMNIVGALRENLRRGRLSEARKRVLEPGSSWAT